jgi:putative PIN family toxin of toxin-antitoxin system
MTRVVLDTNVIVSAFIKSGSIPESVFEIVIGHPKVQLYISKDIMDEYKLVLSYGKFKKYLNKDSIAKALRSIKQAAVTIKPSSSIKVPKLADSDDEKFLACAVAARATYLITGNIKHFPQASYGRIRILTPREFYDTMFENLAA